MKTKLTKTIANILGRAAVDIQVEPKAMEMLRYYGIDYEYMHSQNGGADFDENVRQFAPPPNDIQDVLKQWDGKPKVIKGTFVSVKHAMQCRIFEQNFFNLTSEPVETYWNELHEAILQYLDANEKVAA